MTQAISPSTPLVQLTSMSPLETVNAALNALRGSATDEIDTNSLLLYPGEPGEILVRLENPSDRALTLRLEVDGDYPPGICLCCLATAVELAPKQSQELSLLFKTQADFFEHSKAVDREHPTRQLDYQIQIYVHQEGINPRLVGYQAFTLHLRPRTFYLDFLPAFFREGDFLQRFLAIFEQTFDPYVQTIDALWAYLDPLTAPESLLPFLAHWVAWRLEPDWNLENQRRLIQSALELYRWHGTRHGLRFYLHLYTDLPFDEDHIRIEEVFGGGFTFGDCRLGHDSLMGGGRPYHFVVHLHPEHPDQAIDELLVRTVIEREKPPFCTYDLDIDRC
jgi:phage tail-like protein